MYLSWLTLLPPILVIFTAALFRQIHLALLSGIVCAALVASQGAIETSLKLLASSLYATITDPDNLLLYGFLIVIGILVALFNQTGSAASFCQAIQSRIQSKKGA